MDAHPVANLFPMMTDEEYRALVDDMRQYGQREPIWTLNGAILDGRNRYRACDELGIEPYTDEYRGSMEMPALVGFVVSLNLKRRHLNSGQRSFVALEIEKILAEELEKQRREKISHYRQTGETIEKVQPSQTAAEQAAKITNTNQNYVSAAKKMENAAPDLAEKVKAGKVSMSAAKKELNERVRQTENAMLLESIADVPDDERYTLIHSAISDLTLDSPIDIIITDPPYPREYLSVYGQLAEFAADVLPDGGSLLVMVGQSYLPDILAAMTPHIGYHWTLAYLTPGGQAVQLWQKNVNTFWKPVLWFVKGNFRGQWAGDVVKSATNDNDKRFHEWGQSLSGMTDLIERFTKPGDVICDPFCGGGATGAAALASGRLFIGADIDAACLDTTRDRLRLEAHYA